MKKSLLLVMTLALCSGIYLMWTGGPVIIFMGLLSLYFAYGYTGGPFPLSYNGLGEIAAFIFFGVIAVTGTTYLQTLQFSRTALCLSFGPGFISATILAINNLRDIKSDTETNKRTIAVRFGEKFQRKLCLALIFLSSFILLPISFKTSNFWLTPIFFLPITFTKNWLRIARNPIDRELNNSLAKTAQYLLLYCLLISLILVITTGKPA
jgi:1,4-dihydroxy-2-naphthoate octaprenyltransferase